MLLRLPDNLNRNPNSWNNTLHGMLARSGVFAVEFRSVSSPNARNRYFPNPRVAGARNREWSTFELDGVLIGLDTWDTLSPPADYERAGLFQDYLRDISLVIKVQHHKCDYWNGFESRNGKKATAWTEMPTHVFPIDNPPFRWKAADHQYIACVTGQTRRFGRQAWLDWAARQNDFYSKPDRGDSWDVYFKTLETCRWGLSLCGRSCAVKNRREVEFSACGMPLALNYCPEYPFDMSPGVDFVFLKGPEDLEQLRHIDPTPFAIASARLFTNHFSPKGAAETLARLIGRPRETTHASCTHV